MCFAITDNELPSLKSDRAKFNYYVEQAFLFEIDSVDLVFDYGEKALEIANRLDDPEMRARSLLVIGRGNSLLEKYDSSIESLLLSLNIFDSLISEHDGSKEDSTHIKNRENLGRVQYHLAEVYRRMGKNDKAMEYCQLSKAYFENTNHKIYGSLLNCFALINFSKKEYRKSLVRFDQLLEFYSLTSDSSGLADTYNNRGLVYFGLEDYESAHSDYENALHIFEEFDDKIKLAVVLFNLGLTSEYINDTQGKLDYFQKSLEVSQSIGFMTGVAKVQFNFAIHYFYYKDDFDKTKQYLLEVLKTSKENELLHFTINSYDLFVELYERKGDYKKALEYEQLHNKIQDSLYSKRNEKVANLEAKYKTEKHERELELLAREKEITALTISQQLILRNFLIALLILLIAVSVLIYSRYSLKKKTNAVLNRQKKELETLNNTKDKFFSIIAHDLKNPMGICNSLSGVLCEDFDEISNAKKIDLAKNIKKASTHTYDLLENLLHWARSQSGLIDFNPTELTLCNVVNENLNLLTDIAGEKNIGIIPKIDDGIKVTADKDMVSLILRNLLSNAIKFSFAGGRIIVEAIENDGFVEISVRDSGIGINRHDLEKLFRIDVNTATIGQSKQKGTGLGLILCKEFVEQNGGRIWAEGELNQGCVFYFTLPIVH